MIIGVKMKETKSTFLYLNGYKNNNCLIVSICKIRLYMILIVKTTLMVRFIFTKKC